MGGVAGPPRGGGRGLTRWYRSVAGVGAVGDEPVVLVVPPGAAAAQLTAPGQAIGPAGGLRQERGARRALTLTALAGRIAGQASQPAAIAVDAAGRRRLAGTPLYASVAERDGWAAAALSTRPVGVDLEAVSAAAAAADAILTGVDAADPAMWHGLAGLWAAREAVLKAVGRDLTRDPGGWRFAAGSVRAAGIAPHRVDLLALGPVVAAVAYPGI